MVNGNRGNSGGNENWRDYENLVKILGGIHENV